MTPAQLDRLRAIDAHLTNLLEIAEKRTPGEWRRPGWLPDSMYLGSSPDSAFIASCAGNAEAGWRATKAAIECVLAVAADVQNPKQAYVTLQLLESILAAWPLELLK